MENNRPKFLNCEIRLSNPEMEEIANHPETLVPILSNSVADNVFFEKEDGIEFNPEAFPNVTYNYYQSQIKIIMEHLQDELMSICEKHRLQLIHVMEEMKKL
jgi:hypothetical protein